MGPNKTGGDRLEQAKAVFDVVVEASREQRSELLDELCGDDAELRIFVQQLLESDDSPDDSFLSPPARSPLLSSTQAVEVASPSPRPGVGTTIGPYEITELVGEGGMGTVWKGRDSVLQRPVAIKLLADHLGLSYDAQQRFLREARAASALSHPGIATVFNAGEHGGRVYLVFRFIDGETVAERAKRGLMPVADALRLAREAAMALGHAHDRGVLHRDVTSRNVMIDHHGSAVIVDFGLALPEGDTRITRTGSTLGTVGYMAPEIVRGQTGDRRADIYGLGAVLYEMLTGTLPFEADRVESVLYMVVNEPPEAPSQRRTDLPRDVDRVLLKLLAKDPDRRYQTTDELVEDLRRVEQGVTPAADVRREESTSQLWSADELPVADAVPPASPRRRWTWVVLAVVAIAIIVAGLEWRGREPSVRSEVRVAVLPLQNDSDRSEETDYMALGMSESMAMKLGRTSSLRVIPWSTSQNYRPMEPLPLADIAHELGADQMIVGTFRQLGSRLQVRISLVDGSTGLQGWADEFLGLERDLLEMTDEVTVTVATRLMGKLTPDDSAVLEQNPTENVEANRFYLQGKALLRGNDQSAADRALSYFERALSIDPNLAEAHLGIGAVHSTRYFLGWEASETDLVSAESSYRAALALDPNLWAAHRGLLRIAWHRGRSEECLEIGELAKNAAPHDVEALFVRGDAYVLSGLSDLAIEVYQRILELDPMNRAAQYFQMIAYGYSGAIDQAIEAAEESLRRFGDDPDVYVVLGNAHHLRGEVDSARLAYQRALDLFGEGTNQFVTMWAGMLEDETGHPDLAQSIWSDTIATFEPRFEAHPDNVHLANILAIFHELMDRPERAAEVIQKAANHDGTVQSAVPRNVHWVLALAHRGRSAEALDELRSMVAAGTLDILPFLLSWKSFDSTRLEPGYEDFLRQLEGLETDLRSRFGPGREGDLSSR